MAALDKMYKTIMDDHFPDSMEIHFGDQKLTYRKRTWKVPDEKTGELIEKGLRYGENPDQEAALYELVEGNLTLGDCRFIDPGKGLVSAITESDMLQSGKHPGKINLTDIDSALNILKFLSAQPAAVIIKHNNPSGAAYGDSCAHAFERAFMADRIAAFGGCAVFNREVDLATAEAVAEHYLEVLVAPEFAESTLPLLQRKKNLRIIKINRIDRLIQYCSARFVDFKSLIDGGLIIQQSPINSIRTKDDFLPATANHKGTAYSMKRLPTNEEYNDLVFGWAIEQGVTSNSVLYVKDGCTVGIGTGEQDRVGVAEIAVMKAYTKYADRLCYQLHGMSYNALRHDVEHKQRDKELQEAIDEQTRSSRAGLPGSSMISDAFFPFRDGVDVGIAQGITAIAHPGGSLRDFESIMACNAADPPVAMVFTGQRAFKH